MFPLECLNIPPHLHYVRKLLVVVVVVVYLL